MSTVTPKNGCAAHIYSNGRLIRSVDLNTAEEPFSLTVWADGGFGAGGGFNIIEADNGRIRVAEASCRDGICVRQGWVSSSAVPIVCLPNRLVIEIDGGNQDSQDTQIDGVVG